jgi:D-alanyl-D-alanine carboxypeptidase
MAEQVLTRRIENDGLGVFLDGQGATLRFSHSGANEGFQCLFLAYTGTGQRAAIMTNSDRGGGLIPEIMFAIAHEYAWRVYGPKERSQVNVEPAILRGYVGNYQLAPHFFLTVTVEGNQLVTQATGRSKFPILPQSSRDFFVKEFDAELTFVPDSQGRATEVILHQGGQDHHAKRYEGELPQPKELSEIKVDPKLFDGYVGQCQLAPNFILTITREGDALFAQATGQPKSQIFPESEREFFLKVVDAQITFETDISGRATSLMLHQNGAEMPAKRVQ